jgi:hypothetical protein
LAAAYGTFAGELKGRANTMMRSFRLAIVLAMLVAAPEWALAAPGDNTPKFTFAEQVIIDRNEALHELIAVDPQGVRKLVDAIAVAKRTKHKARPKMTRHRDVRKGQNVENGSALTNRKRNPDLYILFQRSSSEAAYDLFQILKQVSKQSVVN